MNFIDNYYMFVLISILTRIFHGIGSSLSACLVYSTSATICKEGDLKKTLGYIEFGWCNIILIKASVLH
jgi:hypothetical protein